MALDDTHRAYLNDHAVPDVVIDRLGIHSVEGDIIFPWTDGDRVTLQRRPWPGESGLYFWEEDKPLHFWNLRDAGEGAPILVVEGTKQSLAACAYAPAEYSVLGMAGCWGWSREKLSRFRNRRLVICLDADAGSNLDVYDAGELLGEKVKRFGAKVEYLRFPGTGTQGLDDYLASVDEEDRSQVLAYEIACVQSKPADRKPTTRKRKMEEEIPDTGGRVGVAINLDRKEVIDKITGALKDEHDGRTLFNFGDVLTRVQGPSTQPIDRDAFYALLADTVACFRYTEATDKRPAIFEPTWPDTPTIGAIMSKAGAFSPLRRVVRVPFLRPDGSVCFTTGYDRDTATVLVSSGLEEVSVPDAPGPDETHMAAKFLMDEWLGDMPFKTTADRANALALVLTPFVRGIVPLAPLAVVSGLQMGVGKNLLADCLALLATGDTADPLPYVDNDEEMRKMITSAFASGAELFVFDEAHEIQGAQLARAVTSLTYNDRILGVSRMAKYPNAVTWVSLGNQVKVNGDMSRRVYFIYLHPTGRDVHDREASAFRHPDLKAWTAQNRALLVSAALTVLRGWVVAGKPCYSRGATMGSFEGWDRMLSGVLAYAGYPEFLTDVKERRSESDFATSYWSAHVAWLHDTFGRSTFTTQQVREAALRSPGSDMPPGMEDATGKDWTRALGRSYATHADRDFDGVRLIKAGKGHKSTIKWATVRDVDKATPPKTPDGGDGGMGGDLYSTYMRENPSEVTRAHDARVPAYIRGEGSPPHPSVTSVDVGTLGGIPTQTGVQHHNSPSETAPTTQALGFDIETASAEAMFTGQHEGPFVRLVGTTSAGTAPTTDASLLVDTLATAKVIYGHNILHFDLPALARHAGADYDALAAKAVDTLTLARLLDPPGAKGMKPWSEKGYYTLDSVAKRLGVAGKSDDLAALAKEFGGYDKIPTDDPRYRAYLAGDLKATKAVYDALCALPEWTPERAAYAKREMRVGAIQARMMLNGWGVDLERLATRVRGEEERVEAARQRLAEWGVPLTRPDKVKIKLKREWPDQSMSITEARDLANAYPDIAVAKGVAVIVPGEPYKSPWSTETGREAIERAFHEAGAEYVPHTESGALALSSDALGEGAWIDHTGKSRPGMLKVYGHLPGVRVLCETLALATGATAKYAEISRFLTPDGRVHAQTGAPQASWRWATYAPALANLSKTDLQVREVFDESADGLVHLTCDLSQVDMRVMAALSQDPAYMEIFAPGRDAHLEMAQVYFGEQTPAARKKTKAFNHAGNYGQGVNAVSERTGLPLEVCQRIAQAKADAYPRLAEYISEVRDLASTGALLNNGFGLLMRADPERSWTQGPALMGQGGARDVMTTSLLRLWDQAPWMRDGLRAVIHDEVVVAIPRERVTEAQEALRTAFTWEWRGVPILCEVSEPGETWADCYRGE